MEEIIRSNREINQRPKTKNEKKRAKEKIGKKRKEKRRRNRELSKLRWFKGKI